MLENIQRQQGKTPTALLHEPEIFSDLVDIQEAFFILSSSRNIGMDIGYIPFTAIASYISLLSIDDTERFIRLIHAMDRSYVTQLHKRQSK